STSSNSKLLGSSNADISGAGSSFGSASGGATVAPLTCASAAAPFVVVCGGALAVVLASVPSSAMVPTLPSRSIDPTWVRLEARLRDDRRDVPAPQCAASCLPCPAISCRPRRPSAHALPASSDGPRPYPGVKLT